MQVVSTLERHPKNEAYKYVDDPEAQRLLTQTDYRPPWSLPSTAG